MQAARKQQENSFTRHGRYVIFNRKKTFLQGKVVGKEIVRLWQRVLSPLMNMDHSHTSH